MSLSMCSCSDTKKGQKKKETDKSKSEVNQGLKVFANPNDLVNEQ